jgi:hypothetical protein
MRDLLGRIIQIALVLFYLEPWAIAFQSKQCLRTKCCPSTSQPIKSCYLFRQGLENFESSVGRRRNFLSTIFVSTSSTLSDVPEKKNGIFRRLRRVLSLPLRFIVFGPLKLLSRILVDYLDPEDSTASIDTGADTTEEYTNQTLLSTSTAFIGELNDVAVVSPAVNTNDESSRQMLEVVSGEILIDAAIATDDHPKENQAVTTISKAESRTKPKADRWAVASNGIDLSGNWQVFVTDQFKNDYDSYLANLGQPSLVRTVALGIVGRTTEELSMTENGKHLLIRGTNVRGVWHRTLVASGTEIGMDEFTPLHVPIMVRTMLLLLTSCLSQEFLMMNL